MAYGFGSEEEEFFEALRATGRLEPPGDSDGFMLVTQNKGNNKIDSYLNRSVDYLAVYDPSNGQLESTATITLRNDAPASGLPLAIIGSNDQGLPLGTNSMFFSFYTPHLLRDATLDGDPLPMEVQREGGYRKYSRFLELAPGQEIIIELSLMGELPPGTDYNLRVGYQPVVHPDTLEARVEFQRGWFIGSVQGDGVRAGTQEFQMSQLQSQPAEVQAVLRKREY
jgi:hypothetical protein